MDINDVISKAIKMEEDGYDFYTEAAAKTTSRTGKTMFESLAQDEVRHKRMLQRLAEKVKPDMKDMDIPLPKERLKSVFAGAKPEDVAPSAGDIEALEFAMGKETESYELYKQAAKEVSDADSKAVMERMAIEEEHHYEILEQTKYYLEQNQNWNIWEDGGPIEG